MLILLERKTPRISTDSTLDHSHLATEVQLSENMQICKNLCNTLPTLKSNALSRGALGGYEGVGAGTVHKVR